MLILGLLGISLPYTLFYLRAAPDSLPGSLLSVVPILGTITALAVLSLNVHVLMQSAMSSRSSLPHILRLGLIILWLFAHVVFMIAEPEFNMMRLILFDLDLLMMTLILSLCLASQFVLPVENGRDRLLAIRHLLGYALGERGPVTFVEEGIARQAYAEDLRPGPGVFLIDNTSAVVLRTNTAFTRAVGPGVVFTKPGERCAEALDLRRQVRRITGPSHQKEANPEAEVHSGAVTQDGISISAQILVTFILDPGHEGSPREGRLSDKPPFEFNRGSVERAVYAHTFGELGDVAWTQIPALLVADVWREEVKQWSLKDLLSHPPDQMQPLDQIREALQKRLMPPSRKDFQTDPDDSIQPSRELEILKARGIRILDIHITELSPPKSIQHERALRWREAWSGEVQAALQEATTRLKKVREEGESDADALLASRLGKGLLADLRANRQPQQRDTLLSLTEDFLQLIAQEKMSGFDPRLRSRLTALREDLQKMPGNCQEREN